MSVLSHQQMRAQLFTQYNTAGQLEAPLYRVTEVNMSTAVLNHTGGKRRQTLSLLLHQHDNTSQSFRP